MQRDDVVLADAAVKGNEPHLEERGGVTLPPSFLPRRTRGGWRQILLLFTAFGAAACSSRAPADHRGIDPGSGGEDNCRLPVEHSSLRRPLWTLIVTDGEWERLHAKPTEDIEVDAEVCVRDERLPIGLEIQGASSRKYPKKSYKLKFNRGVELEGHYFGTTRLIDKVIIKAMATDRSLIRERLAFELWRQMGHEAPRESSLNLQINERYHGLYTLVEPVDKDYLRRRNIATSGHMYKGVRKHGSFADFRPGRPLDRAFEDATYPEAPDYGPLSRLVSVIQDERGGPEAFAEAIATQLSVTDYIDRMIWISFTQNGDAVAQNFFLYRLEQANEPPWRFIPWDSNLSLGADWRSAESVIGADNGFQWSGGNLLAERILEVPEYREHFVARYLELLDTTFHPDTLMATFDAFAAQVSADMVLDQGRWEYPTDGEAGLGAIAEFLYVRAQYARERLSRF